MNPHPVSSVLRPWVLRWILLPVLVAALSTQPRPALGACPGFLRGDCTSDARLDISDPIRLLNALFINADTLLPCRDACDSDDNGALEITDAVAALDFLFRGGRAPAEPFLGCGLDPTADDLECASPPRRCENGAPAIISTPQGTARVGEVFAYRVEAVDPEGRPIAYELADAPGGVLLDRETGRLRWTPVRAQVGVERFRVHARDPCGDSDEQSFDVAVLAAAPAVLILRPRPGSIVNTRSPDFLAEFQGAPQLASVSVTLDGVALDGGFLPLLTGVAGTLSELRDGEHVLTVSFRDLSGAPANAAARFVVSTGGSTTRVIGRVLDPETDEGIPGVEVFFDEDPVNVARSDAAGAYEITSPPPGPAMHLNFVPACFLEGREFCYPRYKRPVPVIAGATYEADPCYLPRIYPTVTFADLAAAGIFDCTASRFLRRYDLHNRSLDVTLHIAAGTHVTFVDGRPPCEHFLSITQVDEDKAPSNLPAELDPFLLITVQPTGMRFWSGPPGEESPLQLPVTFPNPERYAPGNEFQLFSVDHDTGEFTVMGRMVVPADDSAHLVTIEGGLEGGSWHCTCPPDLDFDFSFESGDPCPGESVNPDVELESGFVREYYDLPATWLFDRPQRRRLVYWSGSVLENRVVTTRVRIPLISAVPRWITSRPFLSGGLALGDPVWFDSSGFREDRDVAAVSPYVVDTTGLPDGLHDYEMEVTNVFGESGRSSRVPGQFAVLRRHEGPFGRGWALEDDDRLIASSEGWVLVVEGSGEMHRFLPSERVEPPAEAPFLLAATQEVTEPGSVATVAVLLSNTAAVEGFSFGLAHDPSVVDAAGVRPGAALAARNDGAGPDFFFTSEDPSGVVVAAVVSTDAPFDALLPGTRQEIALADYATSAGAETGAVTEVAFTGALGPLAVPVVLSTGGRDVEPEARSGSVGIGARPLDLVSFSNDFSRIVKTPGGYRRVHPDGSTDVFDRAGRITRRTDRHGRPTTYERDADGQITAIVDPSGQRTELAYAAGRVMAITDAAGRTTRLTYEGSDLVAVTDPTSATVHYGYDGRGLLVSTTDADGRTNEHEYDRYGRYRRTGSPMAARSFSSLGTSAASPRDSAALRRSHWRRKGWS
jgi:YD repeat-containing protein